MRKSGSFLLGMALLLSPVLSFGQEGQGEREGHQGQSQEGQRDRAAGRLNQMAAQLNLTDAQKEQIKPILKDQADKLRALRSDTSLSHEDMRSKAKEINEAAVHQIRPLLNPDQQKKYDEMRSQMKDEAKEQMQKHKDEHPD